LSVPGATCHVCVYGPIAVAAPLTSSNTSVTVTSSPLPSFEYASVCHTSCGIGMLVNGVAFFANVPV